MTPAAERATWALVLDHFKGLRPADLAEMTPYQLHELYLHARDDDGRVRVPRTEQKPQRKPLSEEQHVTAYLRVAKRSKFPAEVIAAQVAAIRATHQRRRDRDAQSGNSPGTD